VKIFFVFVYDGKRVPMHKAVIKICKVV